MKITSFVGGHAINIIAGAEYDPSIRKYRGGKIVATIEPSGQMLNAHLKTESTEPLYLGDVSIPTSVQRVVDADPIPNDCDLAIVSALFVSACKALGRDTSKLLTMGPTVVNENGVTKGVIGLVRN